MKVTIAQIAKAAGVSAGTVSNALNNRKGSISQAKREKIIQVAEEMGYFRRGKRTGVLGLVLYEANQNIVGETPFFSKLIQGIQGACAQNDYQLQIKNVRYDDEQGIKDLDNVSLYDGLLIMGTEMHFKDVEKFKHFKIPFVIVDNAYIMQNCDFIAINNKDGMYEMTKYLIDKGYRKFGLLNSWSSINNFKERRAGFLQAVQDNDIHFHYADELFLDPTIEGSYEEMKNYIRQQEEYGIELRDAYVAMNDYIAIGALRALREAGKEVAITGFDDIEAAQVCSPSLTTVRVDKIELGRIAVARLVSKFAEQGTQVKILVNTQLIERESTKQK